MLRFLIIALLLYIGYRIVVSLISAKQPQTKSSGSRDPGIETHRDQVCDLSLLGRQCPARRLDGERHYFCSMSCLEKYREQLDHTSAS